MPFTKDDPNINRKGRPSNQYLTALVAALNKEGERRGKEFWEEVASKAFTSDKVMTAIIKKFIPDLERNEIEGLLQIIQMPAIKVGDQPLEPKIE